MTTIVQPTIPLCVTSADLHEVPGADAPNSAGSKSWVAPDRRVPYDGVAGVTADGVVAYSNGSDSHWSNAKHYDNGLFMGYKWQCVEFARRWLWEARRLYLPPKSCAYCYANSTYVYTPDPGVGVGEKLGSPVGVTDEGSQSSGDEKLRQGDAPQPVFSALDFKNVKWKKHPCEFHKQGGAAAPVAGSLIIYPMAMGSWWGHIGVIVDVDLDASKVYVADQNRFFGSWGPHTYSAAFRLDVVDGKYYIRDPESECLGWLVC